MKNNYWSA